ncbi:uncharacterized protein METZ01_LOCUS429950 [marine metagenome]|uniref:Large ribosomal RNA subunit accumulation protein YceD n=1 Tax=marine metagenome TaxID=408172 RepID=A0A382Y1D3_9ZZZZ
MELSKSLPVQLKLFNFSKKEVSLSGQYHIADFPRISEIASNKKNNVEVDLSFYLENDKTPCIDGIIKLDIVLPCQRCLEELHIALNINFTLAFVRHEEQGEELGSHYEIYVTEEDELKTIDLISDEILLSIPMVPMHDYDCMAEINTQEIVVKKSENPFSILKNIQIADGGKE